MSDLQAAARRLENRLRGGAMTVLHWEEDPELLKFARSLVPFTDLMANESKYAQSDDYKYIHRYDTDVLFLKRMTLWFKQDFMEWVNQPKCYICEASGNESDVVGKGVVGPESLEEREGGANRVELYQCNKCGTNLRFPRYNKVVKLLETRQGRCGEFANLFGFFCRAVGFETRYILDFTDHVWTEVWSGRFGRWIMADSCEGKIDEPCMYEKGWGKKLNAIFGFTFDSCSEITERYTRKFSNTDFQQRRCECFGIAIHEIELFSSIIKRVIDNVSQDLCQKSKVSSGRLSELERRNRCEKMFFQRNQTEPWEDDGLSEGRISGSLSWKIARGEVGDLLKNKERATRKDTDKLIVEPFIFSKSCPTLNVNILSSNGKVFSQDSITINGVACAPGERGINLVVIDENYGCVLQRGVFNTWTSFSKFISLIPDQRFIFLSTLGKVEWPNEDISPNLRRLCGLSPQSNSVTYACKLSTDWYKLNDRQLSFSLRVDKITEYDLEIETQHDSVPFRISSRVPENIMPLSAQLMATDEQKKIVALKAMENTEYTGFCSKPGHPIYLLMPDCFPLNFESGSGWTSKHLLPMKLLTNSYKKVDSTEFSYPSDVDYFLGLLGPNLISNVSENTTYTSGALSNKRLVALYFSAHWCPPCKRFTPLLAQFYEDHKNEAPDDLEIIFISSDRDPISFASYFRSMPWLALPFDDRNKKESISRLFGIRGIPSLVVLDAISGQVLSQAHAREEISRSNGDTNAIVERWLKNLPFDSIELVRSIEESLKIGEESIAQESENLRDLYLFLQDTEEALSQKKPPIVDPNTRIKQIFQKFVELGKDPNVAAAEAIQIYSNEVKQNSLKQSSLNEIFMNEPSLNSSLDPVESFLATNSKDLLLQLLMTASKYIQNCLKEPYNSKFRCVKVDNKVLSKIVSMSHGVSIMTMIGFGIYSTHENFFLTIPLSAKLYEMEAMVNEMKARFED